MNKFRQTLKFELDEMVKNNSQKKFIVNIGIIKPSKNDWRKYERLIIRITMKERSKSVLEQAKHIVHREIEKSKVRLIPQIKLFAA